MKPGIDGTVFGSITIEGKTCEGDVIIRLTGEVKKRKKDLSRAIYGTSHIVSLDEAKHVYQEGAQRMITGAGQHGLLKLSNEAKDFFEEKNCSVDLMPTPKAIKIWNQARGKMIGLFHVTC